MQTCITVSLIRFLNERRENHEIQLYYNITIEREYGSGGTKIARQLAEEYGIPCYGREIPQSVSQKYNIPVAQIERYEETVTNSFVYTLFAIGRARSGNFDLITKEGHIFIAEQEEIKNFAAKGSSIFLGHCASEALKEYNGVLNIFIRCSDDEKKKKRIITDYNIAESSVESVRKRFDKKRSNYYYANTTRRWDDLKNYDVVLDSSKLKIDGCIAVLKSLLK